MTNHIRKPSLRSPELAYLCGVLAGDGSICVRPEKHDYAVYCSGNPADEKEFYDEVIGPLMEKLFGLRPKIRLLSGGTYGFYLHSKALVEFLTWRVGLPVSPKHPRLRVPRCFFENPLLLRSFISGVFDTDGCVSFKTRASDTPYYPVVSLSSRTAVFVQQVAEALRSFSLRPCVVLDNKRVDSSASSGFSVISRIDLYGCQQLLRWIREVGFRNPKHNRKIAGIGFEPMTSGL